MSLGLSAFIAEAELRCIGYLCKMDEKTIEIPGNSHWDKPRKVVLHKRWAIVHKKSRTRTGGNDMTYPTERECLEGCRHIVRNNPKHIRDAHFPEGVDAAPFWCYENGQIHSNEEAIPCFIQIKQNKKGDYVWSIYAPKEKFKALNEGESDLDALKAEVLELFPDAQIEMID